MGSGMMRRRWRPGFLEGVAGQSLGREDIVRDVEVGFAGVGPAVLWTRLVCKSFLLGQW